MPLKTEIDYIRLYLEIEQTRLRDRLEIVFAIEPEALDAAVPNLMLLPLCEGAIANGASVRPGRARVEIRARLDGGEVRIDVREGPRRPRPARAPPGRSTSPSSARRGGASSSFTRSRTRSRARGPPRAGTRSLL